jgi:hypothetical protein
LRRRRYERSETRRDTGAGHYERALETRAGEGTRVSLSTLFNLKKKIHAKIEAWRNRPIEGEHPYVFLDGIVRKRTWAGEVRNVSLLVAIGVRAEGYRETSAPARAPRRTGPAGRRSCATSSTAG